MNLSWPSPADAETLARKFRRAGPVAFGLEEEIMVLDPETLDLLPCGPGILDGLDSRFKPEMPASHVEIATDPHTCIDDLAAELIQCRRMLAGHVEGKALLATAGVHPFTARSGALNPGERYERMLEQYGDILRQQLVCGLHLHLGLGGPEQVLGVYNAMRSYLPEVAALAANAPIHCGKDSTLASVRPLISGLLPRQGMPPPLESWQEYADHLNWGLSTKRMGRPGEWWWEMRPHAGLGTLEIRVPDAQTTVADAVAVGTFAIGVAAWLARRYDAGVLPAPVATWRINENRSSALRHGLNGDLIDLETGERQPARERIGLLIDRIAPVVEQLGGAAHLDHARELAGCNGAERQRKVFEAAGAAGLTQWLAGQFTTGDPPTKEGSR